VPTHAEVIASTLAERGVPYVFGLPGGEIVAFIEACRRAGIRFMLTGHESSAAWMAQVFGQITGIPGVCASTLGPGATNLVTGVANAFLDRAPMLAITAQIPKSTIETMTHQRLDLQALFAPVTKASISIEQNTEGNSARAIESKPKVPVNEIGKRLAAAQQPLVLIGLGATPSMAPAIRLLIDALQAPFLVTPKAKGIVPEDHPLFLGVASGMAIDGDIVETIRIADLVLAIGFDPVECDKTWFAKTEIVSIDSASMKQGDYRPVEVVGDIAELLNQLQVQPKPWPEELAGSRRAAIRRHPMPSSAHGLSPLRVIEELRAAFPRDGIVACDVGSHKLAMGQFWRSYEPGTFFMSNGLSGMGFGLPAAIAAQLASPEKRVMAVVGDGGMLMMVHDLTLIRELDLPIVTVVFTDRSLSLIRVSESRKGIEPYGVDFHPPDFVKLAEAFGIAARRVSHITELKSCMAGALEERKPFLIEVQIDHREYYDLV
jgi:acetolactate synthase-1/2/3 large subunit